MDNKIFIMSADSNLLHQVSNVLMKDHVITSFINSEALFKSMLNENPLILLLDLDFERKEGREIFKKASRLSPSSKIVVISDTATIDDAVEITKLGAIDFLRKPVQSDRLVKAVKASIEGQESEFRIFFPDLKEHEWLLGTSTKMKQVFRNLEKETKDRKHISFICENGIDVTFLVEVIHKNGNHSSKRLDTVDLLSFHKESSEGYFWTMIKELLSKAGSSDTESCGTLFFKNFDVVDATFQESILKYLKDSMKNIGNKITIVIVFSKMENMLDLDKKNLLEAFSKIDIPPLRDRREDIPFILNAFIKKYSQKYGKDITAVSNGLMEGLMAYDWPGNIIEIESLVEIAIINTASDVLSTESFQGKYKMVFNKLLKKFADSPNMRIMEDELLKEIAGQFKEKSRYSDEDLAKVLDVPKSYISSAIPQEGPSNL